MASFSLRSQRTGQYKEFTILEILKLLGDAVNDEIWLQDGEDVFNLSSFQEIGTNGSSGDNDERWIMEIPSDIDGKTAFYLSYLPSGILLVILNGIIQTRNKDYTLTEKEVRLTYPLNMQDTLQFIYHYKRPVNFQ